MLEKTIYVCEVCGNQSEDKHKVASCEAQGSPKPKHEVGQVVHVLLNQETVRQKAKIIGVGITHQDVDYSVQFLPPFTPALLQRDIGFTYNENCQKCRQIAQDNFFNVGLESCNHYHQCFATMQKRLTIQRQVPQRNIVAFQLIS